MIVMGIDSKKYFIRIIKDLEKCKDLSFFKEFSKDLVELNNEMGRLCQNALLNATEQQEEEI